MMREGTSTIIQYVREGDVVAPFCVQRSWIRGAFVETARWRVPFAHLYREPLPLGPLGYGRDDLIAGGFIKPYERTLDGIPYLSLHP